MNKTSIKQFLSQHTLCVISSINDLGTPEAAVVGFSETDELELVIATSNLSRKYQNMTQRPDVAIVIGWDEGITVQYEGTARILSSDELERYQPAHIAKVPTAVKFKDAPDESYIMISPKWLRYSNVRSTPWEVTELSF